MSIPIELLAAIAAVGLMLLVCVLGAGGIERRRRARHEQAAADLHFTYHDKDQGALPEGLSRFHLMRLGQVRDAERIMRGEANGIGVTIFQVNYTFGVGMGTRFSQQTIVCFEDARLRMPWFFLRPRELAGKLPPPPGLRELNAEDFPAITERHSVAAQPDHEHEVARMFDREMLAALGESPGICLEGWENLLTVYYPAREVPLEEYPRFLELAFRSYTLFRSRGVPYKGLFGPN